MKTTFCRDKGTIFRRYIVMLKRIMIMQAFTAMLVQLILGSTAMGIAMVDAEQQVRARSAYMDDGIEYIAELKVTLSSRKVSGMQTSVFPSQRMAPMGQHR